MKRKQQYAKPGSPPPTPEQLEEIAKPIDAALANLHQARRDVRVAAAERDLARAQLRLQRVELERLQGQLQRARGEP